MISHAIYLNLQVSAALVVSIAHKNLKLEFNDDVIR